MFAAEIWGSGRRVDPDVRKRVTYEYGDQGKWPINLLSG